MVTYAELQDQRNQVEFLRLQLAEQHLVEKLNEKDTPIDGADIIARQGQELLRLNKAHNKVLGKVRARDTEIERLERSNCKFRAKIVGLHTEIQDLRDRITLDGNHIARLNKVVTSHIHEVSELEAKLAEGYKKNTGLVNIALRSEKECSARDVLIDEINDVVKDWTAPIMSFKPLNKVKDLIDEYMNCSREESPEEHNQVEVKVAFLELP